jgi:HlyD family secretion protein
VGPQEALALYITHGDAVAFQVLMAVYGSLVRRVGRRYLDDEQDVEDLTQEVFIKLSQQPAAVKSNLAGWLYWCASNLARNLIRTRLQKSMPDDEAGAFHNGLNQLATDNGDWGAVKPYLLSVITELPEGQRQLLQQYYIEGQTMGSISKRLGITKTAVKKRLDQTLATLRRRLCGQGLPSLAAVVDWTADVRAEWGAR